MTSTARLPKKASVVKFSKRPVTIIFRKNTWFVSYVGRRKHGRYAAAQFSATDHSKKDVIKWIASKSNLEYIPSTPLFF